MFAAASMLGCTMSDLRRAKAAGCDGFKYGRVKIEKVRAWLEANPPDPQDMSEDALKQRKLLAQILTIEHDLAVARGEYTANAEVTRILVALGAQTRAELMSLISESPSWAGLTPAQLQDKAKKFVLSALGRLSEKRIADKPC